VAGYVEMGESEKMDKLMKKIRGIFEGFASTEELPGRRGRHFDP
jgi:hypothetical protein